jgi:hypothetical protein
MTLREQMQEIWQRPGVAYCHNVTGWQFKRDDKSPIDKTRELIKVKGQRRRLKRVTTK